MTANDVLNIVNELGNVDHRVGMKIDTTTGHNNRDRLWNIRHWLDEAKRQLQYVYTAMGADEDL